tara:strand:- start:118 stop:381 length:264 start_codon:yes stop_codon:yes gene_type:complete
VFIIILPVDGGSARLFYFIVVEQKSRIFPFFSTSFEEERKEREREKERMKEREREKRDSKLKTRRQCKNYHHHRTWLEQSSGVSRLC